MAKGLFTPQNPHKYLGDPRKIRFMSAWELRFMHMCDQNPYVLKWGSEEFKVKYFHPIRKKFCMYIPDFIIRYQNVKTGQVLTEVVEIKPLKEVPKKHAGAKKISTYDRVQMIINEAKWTAAKQLCEAHKIGFRVVTEKDMFRQ